MNNTEIKNITKREPVHLASVYSYMNRSIGVRFITSSDELEKSWEDAQFELSAKYQYEGINEHVWDYYLVFCCSFNENDLDKRLQFKIEGDRFCCRKYFLFSMSKKGFTEQKLIERLFPHIYPSTNIQLIKAETIIQNMGEEIGKFVQPSFFTEEIDDSAVEVLLEALIAKGSELDEE